MASSSFNQKMNYLEKKRINPGFSLKDSEINTPNLNLSKIGEYRIHNPFYNRFFLEEIIHFPRLTL